MAQRLRDHFAERGDLLRVSLLSLDARREGVNRTSDWFFDADVDFAVAESGRDRLDRPKFLGFPRGRVGRNFSTGVAAWSGRAGRASDFFSNERKTGDR